MSTSFKILKKSDPSTLKALKVIFNPKNTVSCAAYGGSQNHCDDARTEKKFNLWGPRGDDKNNVLKCYLIFKNHQPAAMLNLGITGSPATVIDRKHNDGKVLELSGLMVRDQYLEQKGGKYLIDKEVAKAASEALAAHEAPGYSKVFASFGGEHPYQSDFYKQSGATKLTPKVTKDAFGANALHPERFKFEGKNLQECSKWDASKEKVSHDGWHDFHPCTKWDSVNAVLFEINSAGDISTSVDEL